MFRIRRRTNSPLGGMMASSLTAFLVTAALLVATFAGTAQAQQDPKAWPALAGHGLRIEHEVKLTVPAGSVEAAWQWLIERFGDLSWLGAADGPYCAEPGIEHFTDVYFDDRRLSLLTQQTGVRHRTRTVISGPAAGKDGRQLLQIKVRGTDDGLSRGEVKFKVDPPRQIRSEEDRHPVLSLLKRKHRLACRQALQAMGLEPDGLLEVVTILQARRRIYLADARGALATVTLDCCTSSSWFGRARWTEVEIELNEIRYTEADAGQRRAMEQVTEQIQQDLMAAFPGIAQDQTPKYNKAFAAVTDSALLPVRTLIGLGMDARAATGWLLALPTMILGVAGLAWWMRRRRHSTEATAARGS